MNENLFPPVRKISKTAQQILQKRYFTPSEKKWEDLVDRVIEFIVPNHPDKETMREMMANGYFIPNSPCLVNSGKSRHSGLLACFVVDFPDNIEGIFKTKLDFALIARKGGGCGTDLSKIRPEGSFVTGSTHPFSGGPVKFADTISHDADALTQAGFRSMAIMFTINVLHPDIIKFITAKTEEGRIANANISVIVDDNFMNKVKNNETYWTEFEGKKYNEYNAKEIFDLIIEGEWKNGEPSLLFRNRIDDSPYKYTNQEIFSTNPCLFKDTILDDGETLNTIENLKSYNSWKTGLKKCIKLITNAGHEIILTPEHKIMLDNGDFIDAQFTKDKQIKWGLGNKNCELIEDWQVVGFLFGDGFICGNGFGISVRIDKNKENEIYDKLLRYGFKEENCGTLYINKKELEAKLNIDLSFLKLNSYEKYIPDNILFSDYNILGSFISGIFEANGSTTISNNQISFKSISKKLIQQIQIILGYFGIESWIVENKPQTINWNNGKYISKNSYNLQIAPRNSYKFKEKIGFISNIKNNKIKQYDKKYKSKLIISKIYEIDELQEVWDFETNIGYNYANGIFAHNCSEQPLPINGSCNLGSLDLSKFLNKNKQLDYEKLEIAVRLGVDFLDKVISVSDFPTKDIGEWALKNRPIGLGIMGWADYCLIKEVVYGGESSNKELEDIIKFIYKIAEDESIKLGRSLGIPEMCQKLPTPRRNITLLTVAPTGSVSLIAGCSSGIEPIFSEITIRNDKTGTYTFENDLADKPYFRCAVSSNGAQEVTWEEHIGVLASAQKYVDSGVSKTVNFPTLTRRETFAKAIFMAWELGCKGVATYRNGSRKTEVLSPKNIKKDKCPVCGNDLIEINGKLKCISCKPKEESSSYYD